MSNRDIAAQAALDSGPDAIRAYLKANDPEGFGCACGPNARCGPCSEYERQRPLKAALVAAIAQQRGSGEGEA